MKAIIARDSRSPSRSSPTRAVHPFNASPARYDSSMANENAITIAPELWEAAGGGGFPAAESEPQPVTGPLGVFEVPIRIRRRKSSSGDGR